MLRNVLVKNVTLTAGKFKRHKVLKMLREILHRCAKTYQGTWRPSLPSELAVRHYL